MSLFSFLSPKSSSVVGIDIGTSSIKVVQLAKKGGRALLETYGELALGTYAGVEIGRATNLPPEKISEALRDVLQEAKISSQNCALAIPFGASLISAVEMPEVPEKQLEQMVPFEARKYIPVPIDEVALDWWVVPKPTDKPAEFSEKKTGPQQGGKIDVILVAIHNDTLAKYQTIVNQAQLEASFFEIEIFSAIRSVVDEELPVQMIIDIGAGSSKFYIVEHGVVKISHIINQGSQDITLALSQALSIPVQTAEIMKRDPSQIGEQYKKNFESIVSVNLDHIFSEAHRLMLSFERRYNHKIPNVAVVGGGALLAGVLSYAETQLQTKVTLGNPFSKTEAPASLAEILKTTGPEFAVAVGIALRKLSELR